MRSFLLLLFSSRGQSLIELLVTIGMAAILMPAFLTGFTATRTGRAQQDQRLKAISYMREAAEAVRVVREAGWNSFPSAGTYHPTQTATSWQLSTNDEQLDASTNM